MATDVEKLVVQLSADIKQYQREMNRAQGVTNAQARAIENRYKQMDKRLSALGQSAARGLIAPLTGVAAALSVQEVLKYADAWTSAKNSLAVAGVIGDSQVKVLDDLYASAQRNATPIGALADLYGRAAQAQKELGATSQQLSQFSDGVAVALRVSGKSAVEASGALTQLGQALGSSRVMAEEFNSINEGARPILIAVANGVDAAGGSVSKLKQLVTDGAISNKVFFDGFLKGLPTIQAMAANATQTIDQGMTKVNNAFTKYIGSQDKSLGATQMLSNGLNALADDFDNVADTALQLATVISAALVGRAIGGMIVKAGLGVKAITQLVAAFKAARVAGSVSLAIGGIGAAAGPLGAIVGVAAASALTYFASEAAEASERSSRLKAEMEELGYSSSALAPKVDAAATALDKLAPEALQKRLEDLNAELDGMQGRSFLNSLGFGDEKTLGDIKATINALSRGRSSDQGAAKELKDIVKQAEAGSLSIDDIRERLDALALTQPGKPINDLIAKLREAIPYMKGLRIEAKNTADQIARAAKGSPVGVISEGYGAQAWAEKSERDKSLAATDAFIDQREADAKRTAAEKELDARTEEIIKAAEKVGTSIDKAAAVVLAKTELANERVIAQQSKSASSAFDLIKGYEGFSAKPYWDVNALRAGYGSDTVTLDDGSVRKVTDGITVTLAGATRDLERRIAEFQKGIEGKIGADTFRSMDEGQQAALTSIAYNYGSLPDRIVAAIKSGDAGTVYSAIKGLGSDNGGINRDRRNGEAEMYLKGAPSGVQTRVEAQGNFEQTLKDQRAYVEALKAETGIRASLSPLVDDYGQKLSTFQAAQQLFTDAQREGIAAGKELTSVQQLLNGDLSTLSPVARDQALAMRALAEETGKAEAAGQQLQVSQGELQEKLQGISEFSKDLLGGFIRDLRDGKSAGEAFAGVLEKIGDRLLNSVLDSLFQVNAAGSGSGGILSGLLGLFTGGGTGSGVNYFPPAPIKAARGGKVSGPGTTTSDSIPALLSDEEFVVNAAATKKNRHLLEAINAGRALKLAKGGGADSRSLTAPLMPDLSGVSQASGAINVEFNAPIDARGADKEGLARVERQIATLKAELPARTVDAVRKARKKGEKV